jgi:dihydroorotate dehydrogenase (fumarate)/dihydroorotate dehydrogenase
MGFYQRLVRPVLFRTDPERVHERSIKVAELVGSSGLVRRAFALRYEEPDERLAVEVAGLRFTSPLGLAAGYDKSGRAVPLLSCLGFGHIEIGSVSAEPSGGNPRPRLFRLPADRAIVVAYGVPNDGAVRVAERLSRAPLSRAPLSRPPHRVPLGINVVNTNRGPDAPVEPDETVITDYVESVRRLQPAADYLCLNLSCPNTRDGAGFFHDPGRLHRLLDGLAEVGVERPLFLKVAPFADTGALDTFLAAAGPYPFVSGFSVNLPVGKPAGLRTPGADRLPGAVSGAPAQAAADRTIAELYRRMDRTRHAVIGSGGVFTARDAYRKIRLGASLVQLLTALVYEGPGVARSIHRELPDLLARDGFRTVADAVGADADRPL